MQPSAPATDATIRPAVFQDSQSVFELIKSFPLELLPRPVSDIVRGIDRFLVAESAGSVVGCVSWQILPEVGAAEKDHAVEVVSLAVAAGFQRRGVGRRLVQAAVERIRPLSPSYILALTFSPPFFLAMGFREVTKQTLMHKIYTGCINCTKYDSPFTCPEVAMVLDVR